jgi:hypothetical protein
MPVDQLDGDLTPEPAIARAKHRSHPAVTQLLQELVLC